jgi:hypothetical protein
VNTASDRLKLLAARHGNLLNIFRSFKGKLRQENANRRKLISDHKYLLILKKEQVPKIVGRKNLQTKYIWLTVKKTAFENPNQWPLTLRELSVNVGCIIEMIFRKFRLKQEHFVKNIS